MDVQEETTSERREKDALQRDDEVHEFSAYKIIYIKSYKNVKKY